MKNQYVGDINDYKKYGLIRALVGNGADAFRVGILWMLTDNDNRNDGQILDYLGQPNQWRSYDPPLFDKLHRKKYEGQVLTSFILRGVARQHKAESKEPGSGCFFVPCLVQGTSKNPDFSSGQPKGYPTLKLCFAAPHMFDI